MEIEAVLEKAKAFRKELSKVLVGQESVQEEILIAILSAGHVLLEGPPGTGKTLLVRGLSLLFRGEFTRIQFTPDLMPADITGTNVYRPDLREFQFLKGPIFCHFLLADEINRAPAKTQSALLEAMQERQVSIDGTVHHLDSGFTVFATQNPIEHEGTYPLPEAQLDRFMFKILVTYPVSLEQEEAILHKYTSGFNSDRLETFGVEPQARLDELVEIRKSIEKIHVAPEVISYIASIVRNTRQFHQILLGASPRSAIRLLEASRAAAVLRGRAYVIPDDVHDLAFPILRHRIMLNPEVEIEGISPDEVVASVLERTEVPRS